MSSRSPLPPGLGIEIDRSVRLADEGHLLLGGCPPRAVRLTPGQVSALIRWLSGAVPEGAAEGLLARDLVRAGLAHPRPLPLAPGRTADVAVVGQAGPSALGTTLDHLAEFHPELRPVVVGATGACAWAARRRGARVVPGPSGGAQARAAALRACSAEFVALVESGARPAAGWLDTALGHFADPVVAAVVPRVLTERPRSLGHLRRSVAAVAAHGAGPDRGADPGPVLPWGHGTPHQARPGASGDQGDPLRPVPVLVVRRSVADLDPDLGAAAVLDLLWRLAGEGWSVRYEPRSRVRLPPTTDMGGYLRACFTSGAVAGPLARRHGGRAAGPELSWSGAAVLVLVASGRPGAALLAGALGGAVVTAVLSCRARAPLSEAVWLTGLDLAHTARAGARSVRAGWWPAAVTAAVAGAVAGAGGSAGSPRSGGSRRAGRIAVAAGAALVLPHLAAWRRGRAASLAGPVTWTALGAAGDAARSLGTWWGMAGALTAAPLMPRPRRMAVAGSAPSGCSPEASAVTGVQRGTPVIVSRR
ncbi:family 2 glycosyl transferase [Nocardiopsis sp. NPDC058631]|uniref:family 2 glycosyl transferase n=1 Tax=Nocardiopsis sp. NPDC058631 TaxID=3346566 RepID=UPI003662FA5F